MPSMILKELQIENIVNQFQNYTCSVYGLLFQSEVTVRNHIELWTEEFYQKYQQFYGIVLRIIKLLLWLIPV